MRSKVRLTLVDNATRRYSVLILTMYLTLTIGLSVVIAPTPTETVGQVVASPEKARQDAPHTTPKRDTIVSKKNEPTIRDTAKVWFLQREHLDEWVCIDEIIYKESRWIPNLWNQQGSSAYGLGQLKESYPYTKNKPLLQFKRAIKYAIYRYGTLCNALAFHNQHGWY